MANSAANVESASIAFLAFSTRPCWIKTHIVEVQADVETHGPVPSPELSAVAARHAADAVGSTLCVIKSLEQQLADREA